MTLEQHAACSVAGLDVVYVGGECHRKSHGVSAYHIGGVSIFLPLVAGSRFRARRVAAKEIYKQRL